MVGKRNLHAPRLLMMSDSPSIGFLFKRDSIAFGGLCSELRRPAPASPGRICLRRVDTALARTASLWE